MAVGLEQILAEGLTQMRDEIIRASQDAGQEASGRTYAQITVQTGREGETVWGTIEAPNYFYTLIRGRGPGKIPANLGQIIMEWAKLKGIKFSEPGPIRKCHCMEDKTRRLRALPQSHLR